VVCERKGNLVKDLKGNSDKLLQLQTLLKKRQTFTPITLHNSLAGHIYVANTQTLTVSSSKIRKKLFNNQTVEEFLPPKIIDYIQQHKLYQPSTDFC
jgi:nicotinate-nucleotide adenylyltransferase